MTRPPDPVTLDDDAVSALATLRVFVTDVVESRPARIEDTTLYPVLHGGVEIGWSEPAGDHEVTNHHGTLGCPVERRGDGARLALSAHHVAPLGATIFQPGADRVPTAPMGTVVAG